MGVIAFETTQELKELKDELGHTMLYCQYSPNPKYTQDWWVNINSNSFLINKVTNESLKLLNAINIPLHPEKHYFSRLTERLNFVLVFPMVPKDWQYFDFVEISFMNSLRVHNIKRNNTGIYRVNVK